VTSRAEVRRRHASGARARGFEAPQVDSPKESVEDLWDIEGVVYPGSPKQSDHEPMGVMIVNVKGDRVCVARKKYQLFRNSEPLWLWRPAPAPELWDGRHHHCLTHALRVIQVCSRTFDGHHQRPEDRVLRGGIDPSRLLQLCGAAPNLASELVHQLCDFELLREESPAGRADWFVNTRIRGIGPDRSLMDSSDIPEMVLPEFIPIPLPVPAVQEPIPPTIPEEAEDAVTATAEQSPEINQLLEVYRYVLSLVPTGADVEDGFAVFTSPKDLKLMIAERFSLSDGASRKMLDQLKSAEVYWTKQGGHGKPWRRFVKLESEQQVLAFQANGNTAGARRRAPAPEPIPAPPVNPPVEDGVTATPEQLNQLWEQLAAKLDEYAATIEARDAMIAQLEQQLADEQSAHEATKAELEAERAKPKGIQTVLPASLAKHLGLGSSD